MTCSFHNLLYFCAVTHHRITYKELKRVVQRETEQDRLTSGLSTFTTLH